LPITSGPVGKVRSGERLAEACLMPRKSGGGERWVRVKWHGLNGYLDGGGVHNEGDLVSCDERDVPRNP
jgi:hypothetical protein